LSGYPERSEDLFDSAPLGAGIAFARSRNEHKLLHPQAPPLLVPSASCDAAKFGYPTASLGAAVALAHGAAASGLALDFARPIRPSPPSGPKPNGTRNHPRRLPVASATMVGNRPSSRNIGQILLDEGCSQALPSHDMSTRIKLSRQSVAGCEQLEPHIGIGTCFDKMDRIMTNDSLARTACTNLEICSSSSSLLPERTSLCLPPLDGFHTELSRFVPPLLAGVLGDGDVELKTVQTRSRPGTSRPENGVFKKVGAHMACLS